MSRVLSQAHAPYRLDVAAVKGSPEHHRPDHTPAARREIAMQSRTADEHKAVIKRFFEFIQPPS